LPADTKEQELISFLNEMMYEMKLTRGVGRPVMSAQLNLKKRYALVEFRTPEEATAAQKLHNVLYRGFKMDIKRPKDYADIVSPKHTVDITSILVADSPYKIFVGGIPAYLTEEQVIELFQSFGPLRAFNLVKDAGSSLSKGFGFCEYMDTNITDIACQGLNGMDLGGKKLIVQRASQGANKPLPAGTSASATLHSIVPTKALTGASSLDNPTNVLLLLNMFDKEDIDEPSDYSGILNDIRSELSQYGAIKKVFIPYPGIDIKSDLGKAFVHYEKVDDCVDAIKQLAGRRFQDRLIVTAFYPEDKFLKGIYAE
jgi:splicing factor U2AF subunit